MKYYSLIPEGAINLNPEFLSIVEEYRNWKIKHGHGSYINETEYRILVSEYRKKK